MGSRSIRRGRAPHFLSASRCPSSCHNAESISTAKGTADSSASIKSAAERQNAETRTRTRGKVIQGISVYHTAHEVEQPAGYAGVAARCEHRRRFPGREQQRERRQNEQKNGCERRFFVFCAKQHERFFHKAHRIFFAEVPPCDNIPHACRVIICAGVVIMYEQTEAVYADVLFLINFCADFIALFIAGRLCGRAGRAGRLAAAAALGGMYSFV
ncbi:MAG: sigma-E processing peptidase SpoIIGA, partial [Clostridia bacterium]|nr:sigma-E processing peptidase SpoIIGA [Clostridia bacterium]